jgi:hypothetical protein
MNLEAEFYRDVHALECKYAEKFKALYEKVGFPSLVYIFTVKCSIYYQRKAACNKDVPKTLNAMSERIIFRDNSQCK